MIPIIPVHLFYFSEGFSCVPTKFDSTLIETPNKVELIQTVAQCKLMEGCYRIPYVEYHYETTYSDDGVKVESLRVSKPTQMTISHTLFDFQMESLFV